MKAIKVEEEMPILSVYSFNKDDLALDTPMLEFESLRTFTGPLPAKLNKISPRSAFYNQCGKFIFFFCVHNDIANKQRNFKLKKLDLTNGELSVHTDVTLDREDLYDPWWGATWELNHTDMLVWVKEFRTADGKGTIDIKNTNEDVDSWLDNQQVLLVHSDCPTVNNGSGSTYMFKTCRRVNDLSTPIFIYSCKNNWDYWCYESIVMYRAEDSGFDHDCFFTGSGSFGEVYQWPDHEGEATLGNAHGSGYVSTLKKLLLADEGY